MSETTVSATVAFLFGGMVFLLAFTRLGGLWTVGLAGAILVVYIGFEIAVAIRAHDRAAHDWVTAMHRFVLWDRWDDWRR